MVLGRFKEAVSDVAETIRRAFQDPPCRAIPAGFVPPGTGAARTLETTGVQPHYRFGAQTQGPAMEFLPAIQDESMLFDAHLCREDAWTAWASGAKVCELALFRTEGCGRLEVPSLPRAAVARRAELPSFRVNSRFFRDSVRPPAIRSLAAKLSMPRVQRNLEAVLSMPIAIAGEDFNRLPKALNMRFTFQLVKATGENIRNLDVLGVYPVPVRGVTALRHDPKTGRLLVNLGAEAAGATRGRFILARKKDDRTFVSCFVEE